ncbi:TPA: DUF551 domain-containing protein [Enterobacter hormaechei subsp. steigerwaltii]|nr:DUF551 domain-containing protein [Enterobacter hormaechei subsp. steigerwaltii]HDT0965563.1 DUF551 domain-containing protein [Enterobacter hormaechei subsp. steigerwaltii]
MSTLTKEWLLKTIAELEEVRDAVPGAVNEDAAMALAAMKLALASLEAKPIGAFHISDQQVGGTTDYIKDGEWPIDDGVIEVYTAPPAPVSVPDELSREEYKRRFMEENDFDNTFRGGWNACRAAMLQGADGNSPVIPDGWVACSERVPEKADEVLCAKEFDGPGDWRQKVGYYLAGKWTVYSASWTPTHWMPLPAAPQQEVK